MRKILAGCILGVFAAALLVGFVYWCFNNFLVLVKLSAALVAITALVWAILVLLEDVYGDPNDC